MLAVIKCNVLHRYHHQLKINQIYVCVEHAVFLEINGNQKKTSSTQRKTVVISYYGRSFQFFQKTEVTTSKP